MKLKITDLINSIEEKQKLYNHPWRKHEPRIYTEKNTCNKKLINWRNITKLIYD